MSLTTRIDALDKNYLINGHKAIFQRSVTTVNLTNTPAYVGPDRFQVHYLGATTGVPTVLRSTVVPADGKSRYSQQFTSQRNASTLDLVDSQKIESDNAIELVGETVSYGCWVNSTTATQVKLTLRTPSLQDDYTINTQIYTNTVSFVNDGAFHFVKFENINMPTSVNLGLQCEITLISPLGTDVAIQNHYITRCKLNKGDFAQDFSLFGRDFIEEISRCQRYFEEFNGGTGNAVFANGHQGGGSGDVIFSFSVEKRKVPTITNIGATFTYGNGITIGVATFSLIALEVTKKLGSMRFNSASPQGTPLRILFSNTGSVWINAEIN